MSRLRSAQLAPRYEAKKDCEEDYGQGKCSNDWNDGSAAPSSPASAASGAHGYVGSSCSRGGYYYSNSYYSPSSSGFAYSAPADGDTRTGVKAQPVYQTANGQTRFGNGQEVVYGKQTMSVHGTEITSPTRFAPGQSVARGAAAGPHATPTGAHGGEAGAHGATGARSGGFGSIGHGFSSGG